MTAGVAIYSGCTSTVIERSVKAPGASVNLERLTKVMVVAKLRDEASRRLAEDRMAAYHKAFRISYNKFTTREIAGDSKRYYGALKRDGFDGVLSIRILAKGTETKYVQGAYVPGSYIRPRLGSAGNYNSGYYLPGYYRKDTKYWIETSVFSLRQNKTMWSGVTSTNNVSKIDETVGEVLDAVYQQMIKDNFISNK